MSNEWFERGELPPVGEAVLYSTTRYQESKPAIEIGNWYRGIIIAYHDGFVWTSDNGIRSLEITKFRPIRTEREKAIEAAISAASDGLGHASYGVGHVNLVIIANSIYDAGLLRLPEDKL